MKFNAILHPGANPNDIQLKYSSNTTHVSEEYIKLQLNKAGQLHITTSLGEIIEHSPISHDQSGKELNTSYTLENDILQFELENYDPSKEVIIDPWIVSPTYNTSTAVWGCNPKFIWFNVKN